MYYYVESITSCNTDSMRTIILDSGEEFVLTCAQIDPSSSCVIKFYAYGLLIDYAVINGQKSKILHEAEGEVELNIPLAITCETKLLDFVIGGWTRDNISYSQREQWWFEDCPEKHEEVII